MMKFPDRIVYLGILNCVEGWQTAQFKKKNLYSIAISLTVQLIAQIKELAYN
ncbi:MAG: hypothetical protein KHZ61_05605 [Lachnospiraceae bacterium]|nr:hypothetical protein [Lachnospiraceae bacterium]